MAKEKTARAEKYPELDAAYNKLEGEKEKILGRTADLRKKRDALRDRISKEEVGLREMNEKLKKDQPRLAEIDNQLGGLARAMGGRSLANPEA